MNTKAFLIPFFLLPLPLRAAVPADFANVRTLAAPPTASRRLAEVRLDDAVMAATRHEFPDLRLFDAENREIPHTVERVLTAKERTSRYSVDANEGDIRELAGNRVEARFGLEPGAPSPTALEIRTPLRDFIRTVRVTGSEDGQFWQPLAEAEIHDYASYLNFRRTIVPLPTNYCRFFSIEIVEASEESAQPFMRLLKADGQDPSRGGEILHVPFHVSGVLFWQEASSQAKDEPVLQEWPHAGMEMLLNRRARTTEIVLDVHRAPLSRIDLESPVRNFNRLVTIQVPAFANGKKSWQTLVDGVVTRIDVPGIATNDLSVHFPEQRVEQLRVVIQHANSSAINITGVRTYGPAYRMLWIADPAAKYRLAYGNPTLASSTYDLSPIRTALDDGIAPDLWQLAPPPEIPIENTPFFFGRLKARTVVFGLLLGLVVLAVPFFVSTLKKRA